MAEHRPAEVFPPGEFIREELEARGWTQEDLAKILDRPLSTISAILTGRKAVTPETAIGLAKAFGTSAEVWLNLEATYQLSRVRNKDDGAVALRAKLYAHAPVKELVKRGWIIGSENPAVLEQEIKEFVGTDDLDKPPNLLAAARMSTDYYRKYSPPQLAWLYRSHRLGQCVIAEKFNPQRFARNLPALRTLIASEHDVRRVARFLAELGVRLIVVEHLPKTRIDGATVWLDDGTPVVTISLRYDRIDSFWFTLIHELIHVKHGDGSLDIDLVGEEPQPECEKPEFERRADEEAADFLVPKAELEGFITRVRPLYSKARINQFANRIQVHPGIILGQLQRRKELGYWHSREMLVKVRDLLMQSTLTDGWGNCPVLSKVG
jgi:HTH-type transcriptional regulator/antitoxin HigA